MDYARAYPLPRDVSPDLRFSSPRLAIALLCANASALLLAAGWVAATRRGALPVLLAETCCWAFLAWFVESATAQRSLPPLESAIPPSVLRQPAPPAPEHELEAQVTARTVALQHQVRHDPLTRLANRSYFLERLRQVLAETRHSAGRRFAVMFLDVDRFKEVNDSIGHLAGDDLICGIAARLKQVVAQRELAETGAAQDLVARIGGDEFVLLLSPVQDPVEVASVARDLLAALQPPFAIAGRLLPVTVSIGVAVGSAETQELKDVLSAADAAMYEAKRRGVGRFQLWDTGMQERAERRRALAEDLGHAIRQGELRLAFQPIVSLNDERIECLEALLRWEHPQRGLVVAAELLPLAEETELIVPLNQWALREACRQAREWAQALPAVPRVAVNVSAAQFRQADFSALVQGVLDDTALSPEALMLEIPESATMGREGRASTTLKELKQAGVGLSCDDFASGYTSLARLHRMPLDELKIDRSFLAQGLAERCGLVPSLVSLGHTLGLRVAAQGVETADQADWLRSLDCDRAQGYHYSRPLRPDATRLLLEREHTRLEREQTRHRPWPELPSGKLPSPRTTRDIAPPPQT